MHRTIPHGFALALCVLLIAGVTTAPLWRAHAQEHEFDLHEGGDGIGTGEAIGIGIGVGKFIGEQMRRRQIENDIERSIQRQRRRRHAEKRHTKHVDVARVQKCLKTLGLDPGPVDGDGGRKTMRAFHHFQVANGLGKRPDELTDNTSTEKLFAVCEAPPDYGLVKAASDVAAPEPAGKETGKPLEGATVTSLTPARNERQ